MSVCAMLVDVVCAPTKAARSVASKPLFSKRVYKLSPEALTSGRNPGGLGVVESLRPTKVWTRGPPGHVTIATDDATWMRSATVTAGYFCWRARSLLEMSWRPLFSGRLKASPARIRDPSQPPVAPCEIFQVPQS